MPHNDGSLRFLQHMLSKMTPNSPTATGARVAVVLNGSPLVTGDARSGENAIRRGIIKRDRLETVIALSEQFCFNTSIGASLWILTDTCL